jgi:hypothetical protein
MNVGKRLFSCRKILTRKIYKTVNYCKRNIYEESEFTFNDHYREGIIRCVFYAREPVKFLFFLILKSDVS